MNCWKPSTIILLRSRNANRFQIETERFGVTRRTRTLSPNYLLGNGQWSNRDQVYLRIKIKRIILWSHWRQLLSWRKSPRSRQINSSHCGDIRPKYKNRLEICLNYNSIWEYFTLVSVRKVTNSNWMSSTKSIKEILHSNSASRIKINLNMALLSSLRIRI